MASKRRSQLVDTVRDVLMLVPNLISTISNITALINLEARLAGQAAVTVLVLAVICATLMSTAWLCLLAMLFVYLTSSLQLSILLSLFIVFICNAVLIIILGYIFLNAKKNLFFPGTVQRCRSLRKVNDDQ